MEPYQEKLLIYKFYLHLHRKLMVKREGLVYFYIDKRYGSYQENLLIYKLLLDEKKYI